MNMGVAGLGILITFVVTLVDVIFIPLISTQLTTLKNTAPDASINSTLDAMVTLVYISPLGIVVAGFVGSFVAAFHAGRK